MVRTNPHQRKQKGNKKTPENLFIIKLNFVISKLIALRSSKTHTILFNGYKYLNNLTIIIVLAISKIPFL